MPARNRTHYTGTYQTRARLIRQAAYADPGTRCWRCGKTLPAHGPDARWHAGHLIDGDPASPLLAEASTCNTRAGARLTNIRRHRTSRPW